MLESPDLGDGEVKVTDFQLWLLLPRHSTVENLCCQGLLEALFVDKLLRPAVVLSGHVGQAQALGSGTCLLVPLPPSAAAWCERDAKTQTQQSILFCMDCGRE